MGGSCLIRTERKKFAETVASTLSEEQKEKFEIQEEDKLKNATTALEFLAESKIKRAEEEGLNVKVENALDNPKGFINDLTNSFSKSKIPSDKFKTVQKSLEDFREHRKRWNLGKIGYLDFTNPEIKDLLDDEYIAALNGLFHAKKALGVIDGGAVFNGNVPVGFWFVEKDIEETDSVQELTVQKVLKINDMSTPIKEYTNGTTTRWIVKGTRIPSGFYWTGNVKYNYNGKEIKPESVTTEVDPVKTTAFPILSMKVGNILDAVGRYYFEHKDELYDKDGKLDEARLRRILLANKELNGNLTEQGFINLINDFKALEEQLINKWTYKEDGIPPKFITADIRLFGKNDETGNWTIGKPDLIVVDSKGKLHVLDFKTLRMTNMKNYEAGLVGDKFDRGIKYGKQITRYINMLKSYGFDVDPEPYVILADAWYVNEDKGNKENFRRNEKGNIEIGDDGKPILKAGHRSVYDIESKDKPVRIFLDEYDNGSRNESDLAGYLEDLGRKSGNIPGREELYDVLNGKETEANANYLYIEPRLHAGVVKNSKNRHFSDELAALRYGKEIPIDKEAPTYKEQVEALPKEEREELEWLAGPAIDGKLELSPVTKLSKHDIESRPELISSQEIQNLAESIMYSVVATLDLLQNGRFVHAFPRSKKIRNRDPQTGKVTVIESEYIGLSHEQIIRRVGIDNLLEFAFERVVSISEWKLPTQEEFNEKSAKGITEFGNITIENEDEYKKLKKQKEKAEWLVLHKEQLFLAGFAKMIKLEDCLIPINLETAREDGETKSISFAKRMTTFHEVSPDSGDNVSNSTFGDRYVDGLTPLEAWMLGARHYSPKASLSQEIRKMLESITLRDEHGNKEMDKYGWNYPQHLNSTHAVQTILRVCKDCETLEQMYKKMETYMGDNKYHWMKEVIDKLKSDEDLETKFFRNFRKDYLVYSICTVKIRDGKRIVETRIINMKSAYDVCMQSVSSDFYAGKVGAYKYIDENGEHTLALITTNNEGKNVINHPFSKSGTTTKRLIENELDSLTTLISTIYRSSRQEKDPDAKKERIKEALILERSEGEGRPKRSVIQRITNALNGIGVMIPEDVVRNYCFERIENTYRASAAGNLISAITTVLSNLETQQKTKGGIPKGFTGNKAFAGYKPLIAELSSNIQEYVEDSVYQDGKTYYSYSNPSRLGHIIRNLKDSMDDKVAFKNYIQENFGRYTGWYRDVKDQKWLCDWLDQFTKDSKAREALMHRSEISYLGNQYRDLGSLGFALSLLHNYFGTSDDAAMSDGKPRKYRWFGLPTMSNKPTNEFIRMLTYENPDEIIDKVLMNTFIQEMNRMADVLHHFTLDNAVATDQIDLTEKKLEDDGWDKTEIEELKARIKNKKVTRDDLIKLSKITNGAKFHFLWYLNNEINDNKSWGDKIADRLNVLLTPEDERSEESVKLLDLKDTHDMTREIIKNKMEKIVEDELEEFKRIGLFDTEKRKIGNSTVEVLKYQEEFNGNLGTNKEQMEEALRDYIWQDIAANINIIQITGGDLAYYGNAVNYQKRIAQIHSPGLHLRSNKEYDDGFLRSVYISDSFINSNLKHNTSVALQRYLDTKMGDASETAKEDYRKMISIISSMMEKINTTDGQSYSCMTSIKKKLKASGQWDNAMEEAYKKVIKGDFNIETLGVLIQPLKPFVTSDLAKYSGSPTMTLRRTPIQAKNSEYLLLIAGAIAEGSGMRNKFKAINGFMERTAKLSGGRRGIDTVHFNSVGKVGVSGVIDLDEFDKDFDKKLKEGTVKEEDYNDALENHLLNSVFEARPASEDTNKFIDESISIGKIHKNNVIRNNSNKETGPMVFTYRDQFVDTVPFDDYIIQQEVPAHLLDQRHEQLYGSQIRILGISDISEGTVFDGVYDEEGKPLTRKKLVDEYKKLHAANIEDSFNELMEELGLNISMEEEKITIYPSIHSGKMTQEQVENAYKRMENILQKALSKDAKYGLDARRACTLQRDDTTNSIEFAVPLLDPIQSKRIQMLINSIIKSTINKQRIKGGSVVQTTAFDHRLNVVFKDRNGKELQTLNEYLEDHPGKTIKDFKEYLAKYQAGIAYYEAYISVPDPILESLITKPDGSLMSAKEVEESMPEVWDAISQIIGYRIPTEDKYSMIPMKIKGFVPKAAGQVVMLPQEITHITGADFDIDKIYVMLKSFNMRKYVNKKNDKKRNGTITSNFLKYLKSQEGRKDGINEIKSLLKRSGNFRLALNTVISNGDNIINGDNTVFLNTGLDRYTTDEKGKEKKSARFINEFAEWYRKELLRNSFSEIKNLNSKSRIQAKRARDNRIIDLQWAVLTHEDTVSKILNPGNFNEEKKIGRIIKVIRNKVINPKTGKIWTKQELSKLFDDSGKKGVDVLDALVENSNPHNTTLPTSKLYFQRQNMQGTQMVGIFANHNVSHAFCSFQKIGIDLTRGGRDRTFYFAGHKIGGGENGPTVLDAQTGFDGQLISKTIARFLAASVDTAKDPTLSDLNIKTFTGSVATTLARMGYNTDAIGAFLSQPIIVELSDLFFKRKTEGYFNGEMAIKELSETIGLSKEDLEGTTGINDANVFDIDTMYEHLISDDADYRDNKESLDYQKRVLQGFYHLFKIATDVQELTFCTKFNSVSNAVGPTIADTMEDIQRVNRFMEGLKTKVFYLPTSADDEFTSPASIIENDPILRAFYATTVDLDGASERIFKNFFPHYFEGFKNVLKHFKTNFVKDNKVDSKLYNQLLDEYIYYLLTYNGGGILATIPTNEEDQRTIFEDTIKQFEEIQKFGKKRKIPNSILDQGLGNNCLRIRKADEFLGMDTLIFNSGRLGADEQQEICNAWSDIITMNDPGLSEEENVKIRKFGVNLFFYSLMRNGFGFSPKTMMHLASVVVRYNAEFKSDGETRYSSYINGLKNLRTLDAIIGINPLDTVQIERFCNQFIRNHIKNTKIVPLINSWDERLERTADWSEINFTADLNKQSDLNPVLITDDQPRKFITIINRSDKEYSRTLYELVEGPFIESGKMKVSYKRASKLGLEKNFIEYDANRDLKVSFFENVVEVDEDSINEEDNYDNTDASRESQKIQDEIHENGEANTWQRLSAFLADLNFERKDRKHVLKPIFEKTYENPSDKEKEALEILGEILEHRDSNGVEASKLTENVKDKISTLTEMMPQLREEIEEKRKKACKK